MRRFSSPKGFSLIEAVLAVLVTSICLWAFMKLFLSSHHSLSQSEASVNAQSSAEDLFHQIQFSKWDNNSQPGKMMDISVPPFPTVSPINSPPRAVEDWNGYNDVDNTRASFGPFRRWVRVEFVDLIGGVVQPVAGPSDRKRVTIVAENTSSSSTISGIFCNLP